MTDMIICRRCKSLLPLKKAREALGGYYLCPACYENFLKQYAAVSCPNCRYAAKHFGQLPSVCLECGAVRD